MCKSVPQIEAAFTRTSTSPCPTSGTGTLSIRNPRAASIFRSAFIVAAIPASSLLLPQLIHAQSQILAHCIARTRFQPPDQTPHIHELEGAPSFAHFSEGWALTIGGHGFLLCPFFSCVTSSPHCFLTS